VRPRSGSLWTFLPHRCAGHDGRRRKGGGPYQSREPNHSRRPLRLPTVTFQLLFVLIILAHDRRRIVHVAVTEHPTAAWTAQQLRNAFSEHEAPCYLLHDRDSVFADVATTIAGMNTQTVRTAPRSPWQNAHAERVIGSIRRECLDHVIVVNAAGLHRLLAAYITYYNDVSYCPTSLCG
jgi:putative transposase